MSGCEVCCVNRNSSCGPGIAGSGVRCPRDRAYGPGRRGVGSDGLSSSGAWPTVSDPAPGRDSGRDHGETDRLQEQDGGRGVRHERNAIAAGELQRFRVFGGVGRFSASAASVESECREQDRFRPSRCRVGNAAGCAAFVQTSGCGRRRGKPCRRRGAIQRSSSIQHSGPGLC